MKVELGQGGRGGLDLEGLGDLAALLDGPQPNGGYKIYPVARIHLGENVRSGNNPGLKAESITEMAESIRARAQEGKRGVLIPISLRPHPTIAGDFLVNHGARRYLGTVEAGLQGIPAHEDPDFDDFDQVLENIQREPLTGREMADFIGGKLSTGMSQADIAAKMGKSKAWVSMHVAMLSLPEPVAEAVANGKVTDVTLAKELVVAHAAAPEAVEQFLESSEGKINRSQVKKLREVTKASDANPRVQKPAKRAHEPAAPAKEADPESEALDRLLTIARRDTPQSKRVADFLLAWWNAASCGGFDLTDFWAVDTEIGDDMMLVIGLMRSRHGQYPDQYGEQIHERFKELVKLWRPKLQD
ncbi:ParB/RepB/Spo0J family partition protein [Achromobacter sp. 413638]|uniref:DUF7673 family protein n=1 Tax=Achromobacter sp. 413638 TaxID=3342385 RepID=UPI00370B473D